MENSSIRRSFPEGIEENTLAMIDTSEVKDTRDANDDRIAFLEAVRGASIVPEKKTPPTNNMYEAVFQILRYGKSLELIMASYQLLNELDKHFPRVYITGADASMPSHELAVVHEAWTPVVLSLDITSGDKATSEKITCGLLDPSKFHNLIQDLIVVADEDKAFDTESLRNMFLFQYLVNVLEGDFLPRNSMYAENMNWTVVRESLLNMILCSRKISFKGLMKDCLTILRGLGHIYAGCSNSATFESAVAKPSYTCDTVVAIALPQIRNTTCIAMQKLLIMIMELDTSKKNADIQGYTTRADVVRTPLLEIILDELTYNKDTISPFLQVFNDPKWKLELVVQYFWKYISKPTVRTRRSNGSTDDATFCGALKCFSNITSTKNVIKKISVETVQLLLAHGFQAFLLLSSDQQPEASPESRGQMADSSLLETCQSLVSAFSGLREIDEQIEISPYAKQAIFTAATILSAKS